MNHHVVLNRPLLTPPFLVLGAFGVTAIALLLVRFFFGMGAVTNLNGGYAWGIWVVYDIVVGTAFACGGYALAVTVYVFNKGRYHPLVRPAIVTSLLGYALGAAGAFIDMGRYWNFYHIFLPEQMNPHAVMFEVALCVFLYVLVLIIEFLPTVLEKFKAQALQQKLSRVLFFFVALGILLPTMHQSSLGSFLIAMGWKVHPLWQTMELQPLLAILSAFIMGFAAVIFEASLSAVGFKRKPESPILIGLAKMIVGLTVAFLGVRFLTLLLTGKLGLIFAFDLGSAMFLLETAMFIYPVVILSSPTRRANGKKLLYAALCMMLAGALYRFDAFLITFSPGAGYSYFPALPEILITIGMVAIEVMAYLFIVTRFPVLAREEH
ncbi:Ni/Fe-hydrogenase cytochrome b subunit [Propionivibrio sp.]|uniref:Ni/Fe-hydrogenase cytochrome b subunit n=1 Tax=Propionivibrio sp. TaxID=2212460 RepID=UPI003BEF55B3